MNIVHHLQTYQSKMDPTERYCSFDYCFNYFQHFQEQDARVDLAHPEHMQTSCLHLGFYLASWGMLRGSTVLLQKSAKYFEGLIDGIAHAPAELWQIDIDTYDPVTIAMLFDCRAMIQTQLTRAGWPAHRPPSDVLVTKIMLGVFGNVPAFDRNFTRGIQVNGFTPRALNRIVTFYRQHQREIDGYDVRTVDFGSGQPTHRRYPKAKIIDMVGFIAGGSI
jgi:hypothetical protein